MKMEINIQFLSLIKKEVEKDTKRKYDKKRG